MDCPRCLNEPMIVLELRGVEIDYCTECGGIWLDEGELELLYDDSREKEKILQSFTCVKDVTEESRKCPVCLKTMEKVICGSENKTVMVDRCRKYHGLWFDKGELNDVLRMSSLDRIDKKSLTSNLLKDIFSKTS